MATTDTEYKIDFIIQHLKGNSFFHRMMPDIKNSKAQINHGTKRMISFSPAPKFRYPSVIKKKIIGVNRNGAAKARALLTAILCPFQ